MMLGTVGGGYVAAMPLEFGWGLAAPFAGPDPDALVDQLNWMWSQRADEIDALLISGIPIDGLWMGALTRTFIENHRMSIGPESVRRIASLDGGMDGFLSRRSGRFRANVRRANRRRLEENICLEYHSNPEPLSIFERIVEIEADSWKGREGAGFNIEPFKDFYRRMLPRLARRSQLRVLFFSATVSTWPSLWVLSSEPAIEGCRSAFEPATRHYPSKCGADRADTSPRDRGGAYLRPRPGYGLQAALGGGGDGHSNGCNQQTALMG